jgi:hypothetical protein
MQDIQKRSEERIEQLHHLAKQLWTNKKWKPIDIQNKCMDAWDRLGNDLDCSFRPLVQVHEDRPVTNLIFGSGGFSTGEFQAEQYEYVRTYTSMPPVLLQGIVTNKSEEHKCNAKKVADKFHLPLAELDFEDWYRQNIDAKEMKPITASRYWYSASDENRPPLTEIARRFKIRQDQYHKVLSEQIAKISSHPTDIASARGYNFQFCRNIFHHQNLIPHANDTHPADLSYVDPKSKEKLYPGWQSGAIDLMMKDKHTHFRGSLIEVPYMDTIKQINELDEGALLALSEGVKTDPSEKITAEEIQKAMKIIDDYFFCTLEPTGMILMWGVSDKALPVIYQDLAGNRVVIKQPVIVVGNKLHSGYNAWGRDFNQDLKELQAFFKLD